MVRLVIILFLVFPGLSLSQSYEAKEFPTTFDGPMFSPHLFHDSLVFCSNIKDRIFKTVLNEEGDEPTDLYIVDPKTGQYQSFHKRFRTDYNDGPFTYSEQLNITVLSQNQIRRKDTAQNTTGLYMSSYENEVWSDLTKIKFVSREYNYTHPYFDQSSGTLFFSSNMKGGYGGYDIWKTEFDGKDWSEPENLGSEVNSENNEVFPSFINDDLYFSSNRNGTDLNIYKSTPDNELYQTPELLDTNINSSADDFSLISKDGMDGYFTSNRSGQDRLYTFQLKWPEAEQCDSLVENVFCYTLYEENAIDSSLNQPLVYEWIINDTSILGNKIYYCFPGPGEYEITLNIIDTIVDQIFAEQAYYYLPLEYHVQPFITSKDTILPNETITLSGEESFLPGVSSLSYYWDLGDGVRKIGKEIQHSYEEGTFEVQLIVTGLEDGVPFKDCSYKYIFSGERTIAEASEDNSIHSDNQFGPSASIDTTHQSYTVLIYTDSSALPDDSFIRKFLISEEEYYHVVDAEGNHIYLIGSYKELSKSHPKWRDVIEGGIDGAQIIIIEDKDIFERLLEGKFKIDGINFDLNSSDLTENAIKNIKLLVHILRNNESLKLQINAHTDNIGSPSFNLNLSEKRAQSVLSFLKDQGITIDRMKTKGFGESQPITTNTTEKGREINRRVEFIIY